MKRRLSLLSMALFAMVGFASLNASDPDPYANTVTSSEFTTFKPSGNFSLQANLANGQSIEVRNANGEGFVYKSTMPGLFSFLVDVSAGTAKVYRSSTLLEEIAVTTSTEPTKIGVDLINAEEHDAALKLGVYSSMNLIQNPGFETGTIYETHASGADIRLDPEHWNVNPANQVAGNSRANNITVNEGFAGLRPLIEGNYAFLLHNAPTPLWQELTGLKPATMYKVAFRQMAHKDTSPVTSFTSMIMADSVNYNADSTNAMAKYTYNSAGEGFGKYIDVTYVVTTPATLPAKTYFVVRKTDLTSGCIQNFDLMTMQEITASDIHYNGIMSTVDAVTWEDGLKAPEGGGGDIYEDVTAQYFTNPSFENTSVTLAANSEDPETGNSGIWMPYGWNVAYSTAKGVTPSLWDQALVTSGMSALDRSKTPPVASNTGFLPEDGAYFYYYRTRWMADQDFTISQTLKNLKVGAYDMSLFAAADQPNPATIKVRGLLMNSMEVSSEALQNYTLPFSVLNDGDSVVVSISVSRIADSQARLVLDHFQLIYRGEPNEDEVLEALKNTLEVQKNEAGLYYDNVPSGIRRDIDMAYELAGVAESTGLAVDYSTAVYAFNAALDLSVVAEPVFLELPLAFDAALEVAQGNYPDADKLLDWLNNEFVYIFGDEDAEGNPVYYYLEDLEKYSADLALAVKKCKLSIIQNATETIPVELTSILSAPSFTIEGGDVTSSTDRSKGAWITANNPATSDQYKLHTAGGLNCWNNWSNSFTSMDVYQEFTDIVEGIYELKALTTTNGVPHDQHIYLATSTTSAVSPAAVYQYTAGGSFDAETEWEVLTTPKLYVKDGETIRVGMASTSGGGTSGWFCVTGFQLFAYQPTNDAVKAILDVKIKQAEELLDTAAVKVMGVEKAALNTALATAKNAETREDMSAATVGLDKGIDAANVSIVAYNAMSPVLEEAKALVGQSGYTEEAKATLNEAIADQEAVIADAATAATDLPAVVKALQKAMDVFRNSNVTIPEGVSPENPYDVTSQFLKNPTIEAASNGEVPEGWTIVRKDGDKNSTVGQHYSGDTENRYLDSYNATAGLVKFTATQTLYGIPNGTYRLELMGRSGGTGAYAYAYSSGTGTVYAEEIPNLGSEGGPIWEAAEEGSDIKMANENRGWGWSKVVIDHINVENNTLIVGVTNDSTVSYASGFTGNWYSSDDFKLYIIDKEFSVGVEDINTGNSPYNVYVNTARRVVVEGAESFQILKLDGTFVRSDAPLETGMVYSVIVDGKEVARIVGTK